MCLRMVNHRAIDIDLRYATADNITGAPIYRHAIALLHPEAQAALMRVAALAVSLELRLIILDAYRPPEAQWRLWKALPDPAFVADPIVGSTHSRGIAVDLTLANAYAEPLDMGTDFDAMRVESYHGNLRLPRDIQQNRAVLLGMMTACGWLHQPYEWWHYNLPNELDYPIINDEISISKMMGN